MNFQQLDAISDTVNPLFAVLLLIIAVVVRKKASGLFILKAALAFVVVQQLAKWMQKEAFVSDNFPSTHYALALCLAVSYLALSRKLWPVSAILACGYGALMLYINAKFGAYHTPMEMLGAFYAIPLTLLFHAIGRKKQQSVASN